MNAVMSGQTVMASLIGHKLSGGKALNTLPMAIQQIGVMGASIPAGIVFARSAASRLLAGLRRRAVRQPDLRRSASIPAISRSTASARSPPASASASPSICASPPPRSPRPRRARARSPW